MACLHRSPMRGEACRRMLKLGAPISVALGLETAAISSLAFMAGHLGAAAAAAHQLTFNFNGLMVMVAVGMSAATAVGSGMRSGRASMIAWRARG